MFTGIVEKVARVEKVSKKGDGLLIEIESKFNSGLSSGASIAVNGACLTVISSTDEKFVVFAGLETISRTNIAFLKRGDKVNLERPIKIGERLEGHFLLGHIDTMGTIRSMLRRGDNLILKIFYPPRYSSLVVDKGSIGVDGVSLTIVEPEVGAFNVSLIPYTIENTVFGIKKVGDKVNLEFDIIVKSIKGFTGLEYERKKRSFYY
ncbi:MAG: riboflavin synthase [bacterium]